MWSTTSNPTPGDFTAPWVATQESNRPSTASLRINPPTLPVDLYENRPLTTTTPGDHCPYDIVCDAPTIPTRYLVQRRRCCWQPNAMSIFRFGVRGHGVQLPEGQLPRPVPPNRPPPAWCPPCAKAGGGGLPGISADSDGNGESSSPASDHLSGRSALFGCPEDGLPELKLSRVPDSGPVTIAWSLSGILWCGGQRARMERAGANGHDFCHRPSKACWCPARRLLLVDVRKPTGSRCGDPRAVLTPRSHREREAVEG